MPRDFHQHSSRGQGRIRFHNLPRVSTSAPSQYCEFLTIRSGSLKTRAILTWFTLLWLHPVLAQQAASYLPLAVGNKWVLRGPNQSKPVVFEVIRRESYGFLLQSITPWGSSQWTLSDDGGKFFMTAYGNGAGGAMMPMPDGPVYLDFTRAPGEKWSNALGTLTVVSRSVTVRSQNQTYSECVQIEHKAKSTKLWSTFAQGVGYVQFGQGNAAFILDESASTLPSHAGIPPKPPAQPSAETQPTNNTGYDRVRIGLTPNRFAHEPLTGAVMLRRLQQTVDAGVTYISGTAKWAELEPSPGRYSFGSVSSFMSAAAGVNLPVSYTLRIIDTVARDVPPDLRNTDWGDPRMRTRALALVEAVAPLLKDRVRRLSVGYEVDGYLAKHPFEVDGFTALHATIKARLKELLPGTEVSSTLTFSGIASLAGQLKTLNSQLDFLSLTYCPLHPDFTVMDPSVVPSDFGGMKQAAAGRRIVLQEIGYPTAPATGGSEDKQAEFYRLSFEEINRDPGAFAAVNFMNLADLSRDSARQFANFYRFHTPAFEGVLQSMGLFNESGEAKKAWSIFQSALKRENRK
jgi:hypothetical protein